jgi:hypothetical protein
MLSPLPAGPVRWVVLTPDGSSLGASAAAKQAWLAAQAGRSQVTTRDGIVVVRLPAPEVVRLPAGVSAPRP